MPNGNGGKSFFPPFLDASISSFYTGYYIQFSPKTT
jgi:hypothetical protein